MQFIESYLNHNKDYESPRSFWFWSAIASIAAVLRDNVWMADGDSRLYPNIYILLLAGSAQRKGRPVGFSEQLVNEVNNVKIISGRASIQAILIDIGQTETDSQGKLKKGGSAIFYAPELSAGLVADDQSVQILTDIYDFKATGHTTNLVGRGKSKLEKVVFSMLAASNAELLKDLYSSKAVQGGLLGRTFLVVPDEFRPANAFPLPNEESFKDLTGKLTEISRLSGQIVISPDGKKFYEDWYGDFRTSIRQKDDRTGILGRLGTNVKKLATIFSANELCDSIQQRHFEQAIHECLSLIPNYNAFIISSGKSTIKETGGIVLEELSKKGCVARKELIRDNWQHFDPEVLDKTMAALELGGIVKSVSAGTDISYILTAHGKKIMGMEGTIQ